MNNRGVCFFLVNLLFFKHLVAQFEEACRNCLCEIYPERNNTLFISCSTSPNSGKTVDIKNISHNLIDVNLSMERMNLTTIQKQRYVKYDKLNVKTLSLNYNRIKTLPSHIFSEFHALESLSIVHNEIENITHESFKGLSNVKLLNLSYNSIKTFDFVYLEELTFLEKLDLRKNLLLNLYSTCSLSKLPLTYLDISNNNLTQFTEIPLRLLKSLKYYNLSNNRVKKIPRNGFEFQSDLEVLDLSSNKIIDIDYEAFPSANKIQMLIIKHNLISDTKYLLKLTALVNLDISWNSVSYLSNTSQWSRKLIEINIGNNGLTSVDELLIGLPQLRILDASWNQCNKLPNVINPELKILKLDANGIQSFIPSRQIGNGSLAHLSLTDLHRLKTIQKDAFLGMFSTKVDNEQCAKLVIKRTSLLFIEKTALKNSNICELDLSWNSLTELSADTFDWDRLKYIDLQGNPWHCSCATQWLLDKVVNKMYLSHQELLEDLRCQTPKELEGVRLVHWYNTSNALCGNLELKSNIIRITSSPMVIALDVIFGIVAIALVVTGFYMQRKLIRKRRSRKNRRISV